MNIKKEKDDNVKNRSGKKGPVIKSTEIDNTMNLR